MTSSELVWTRVHLPRPLDPEPCGGPATGDGQRPTVPGRGVRAPADSEGIAYLLGCPTSVHPIRRMLRDHLNGVQFQPAPTRTAASEAGRMTLKPRRCRCGRITERRRPVTAVGVQCQAKSPPRF